jgi:hypothetical protein
MGFDHPSGAKGERLGFSSLMCTEETTPKPEVENHRLVTINMDINLYAIWEMLFLNTEYLRRYKNIFIRKTYFSLSYVCEEILFCQLSSHEDMEYQHCTHLV